MKVLTKLDDLKKAISRLKEGLVDVKNDLDRDGVIQRFEFTFELTWKVIQEFASYKGLETASPRDSFRVAADLGVLHDPEIWFDFLKHRNASTHIYDEKSAQKIFDHIPKFVTETQKIVDNIEKDLKDT